MSILNILLSATLLFGAGFSFLQLFSVFRKSSIIEILSISYGIGVALISFQLLIYDLLGIKWNIAWIILPWILVFAFVLYKVPFKKLFSFSIVKFDAFEKIVLLLIILLLCYVGLESILRPLSAWDGWATWLFKSTIFFTDGKINTNALNFTGSEYPLLIGLMGTFGYLMLGHIDDKLILILFYLFYVCLAGIFYYTCKELTNKKTALISTFLLLSLQNLIRHGGRYDAGMADLALGYYYFVCCSLFLKFIKFKNKNSFVLFMFMTGLLGLVKDDGIPMTLFLCIVGAVSLYSIKKLSYLWMLSFPIIILGQWELFKLVFHMPGAPKFIQNPEFNRTITVILGISKEFLNLENWNLLWIGFFLSLIILLIKKHKIGLIISLFVISQLLVYYYVFLSTSLDPLAHINNVIDRLLLHIAPVAMLVVSIPLYLLSKSYKNTKL